MTPRLLPERPRRPRPEPVVPMINVVFLLLIFFLMTASLTPPAPFEISPPTAPGEEDASTDTLYVSADGDIAFGEARGEQALAAATASGPVRLAADARLPASDLARILARLAALGAPEVRLVTTGGG
ncbi:biopolymer transporter ExbD [Salipiger sp. P9]|uniref:ExbD/TolR family protein n=1 Tax=Salipiger pentaromativorans TaxID=2943193 RepID=UPI002158415A|nr:biopolymer transporter ExbD [Salipiger pentaromativorans]MCR8546510.1 biopolymer transporter ExbD [Salipiger pentaromativorans]